MKRIPRILLAVFISLFILQMIGLAFLVLAPRLVQAEAKAKEANCWTNSACDELEIGTRWEIGNGCDEGFGKCYSPEPKINLKFGFPGLKEFIDQSEEKEFQLSLADYIGALYNYGVIIAGFLAAIMIMVGGFLWLTAAGSANQITKAKGYIGGAIVGLILALTSYLILETVNPALVRLKSLQVELVPTIAQSTFWCNDQEEDSKVASTKAEYSGNEKYDIDIETTECKKSYYIENGNGAICWGDVCDSEKVCVIESKEKFECVDGLIAGTITPSDSIPRKYDGVTLKVVCDNNQRYSLPRYLSLATKDDYKLYDVGREGRDLTGEEECEENNSTVKGYYLAVWVEDRSGRLTGGWFAVDDRYAFNCDKVIKQGEETDPEKINWIDIGKGDLMQENGEGNFNKKTCNLKLTDLTKKGR